MLDPTHRQPLPAVSERRLRKAAAMSLHAFPSLPRPRFDDVASDGSPVDSGAWRALKQAATDLQQLQNKNGSVDAENRTAAEDLVGTLTATVTALAPAFPHDAE